MIEVTTYQCPKCKQVIYSRCPTDLHTCSCGTLECTGRIVTPPTASTLFEVKKEKLYIAALLVKDLEIDFLCNGGKYGVIK